LVGDLIFDDFEEGMLWRLLDKTGEGLVYYKHIDGELERAGDEGEKEGN